jgi:hypothetical protein
LQTKLTYVLGAIAVAVSINALAYSCHNPQTQLPRDGGRCDEPRSNLSPKVGSNHDNMSSKLVLPRAHALSTCSRPLWLAHACNHDSRSGVYVGCRLHLTSCVALERPTTLSPVSLHHRMICRLHGWRHSRAPTPPNWLHNFTSRN